MGDFSSSNSMSFGQGVGEAVGAYEITDGRPKIIYFTRSMNPSAIAWQIPPDCFLIILSSLTAAMVIHIIPKPDQLTDTEPLGILFERLYEVISTCSSQTWTRYFDNTQLTTVLISRYVCQGMRDWVADVRDTLSSFAIYGPLHYHEIPSQAVNAQERATVGLDLQGSPRDSLRMPVVTVNYRSWPITVASGDVIIDHPCSDTYTGPSVTDIPRAPGASPSATTDARIAAASLWLDRMHRPDSGFPVPDINATRHSFGVPGNEQKDTETTRQ